MDPTEQVPLLAQETSEFLNNGQTPQSTRNTDPEQPSEAELLLRQQTSSSTFMSSLRRLFLPKFTAPQLLDFFNRPAGPRVADAQYTVRLAQLKDVPAIAMLRARADWHMPVMRIFHPLKDQFPQDYLRAYFESNLMWMTKPGALTYVAVRYRQGRGGGSMKMMEEEIIGAMRFSRQGDGKNKWARQHGLVGALVDWTMRAYMRFWRSSWVSPLRSKKLANEAEKNAVQLTVEKFEAMEKKYWERPELKERYYVGTVCVADEWRGRGVGKALMAVATERSANERLPLTLSATEDGVHLYRKMWFEKLDEIALPGGGKDSHYEIMVWDPRKRH